MKNISFALTKAQFRAQMKDVTRRLGWGNLTAGETLCACEKCQGIKPGESLVRMGLIDVVKVRHERLDLMITDPNYGAAEVIREGFPDLSPTQFVEMFCKHMKCLPSQIVTRIEFEISAIY